MHLNPEFATLVFRRQFIWRFRYQRKSSWLVRRFDLRHSFMRLLQAAERLPEFAFGGHYVSIRILHKRLAYAGGFGEYNVT